MAAPAETRHSPKARRKEGRTVISLYTLAKGKQCKITPVQEVLLKNKINL